MTHDREEARRDGSLRLRRDRRGGGGAARLQRQRVRRRPTRRVRRSLPLGDEEHLSTWRDLRVRRRRGRGVDLGPLRPTRAAAISRSKRESAQRIATAASLCGAICPRKRAVPRSIRPRASSLRLNATQAGTIPVLEIEVARRLRDARPCSQPSQRAATCSRLDGRLHHLGAQQLGSDSRAPTTLRGLGCFGILGRRVQAHDPSQGQVPGSPDPAELGTVLGGSGGRHGPRRGRVARALDDDPPRARVRSLLHAARARKDAQQPDRRAHRRLRRSRGGFR